MLHFIVSKSFHDIDQLLFNIGNASLSMSVLSDLGSKKGRYSFEGLGGVLIIEKRHTDTKCHV